MSNWRKPHATRKTRTDLTDAPPILVALVQHYGNFKRIAEKLDYSVAIIRQMATEGRAIPAELEAKMNNLLAQAGGKLDKAPVEKRVAGQALPATDWDGKRRDVKIGDRSGKALVLKKIPGPLADLCDKLAKTKTGPLSKIDIARALGYVTFSGMEKMLEKDTRYLRSLHEKVLAALRGEVIPGSAPALALEAGGVDTFKLKLAIVFASQANYDRIEEIAGVIGGKRGFRRVTKTGIIVIYSFKNASKVGQFKRLALRDASEILCP